MLLDQERAQDKILLYEYGNGDLWLKSLPVAGYELPVDQAKEQDEPYG
jgi:hypothetical protein